MPLSEVPAILTARLLSAPANPTARAIAWLRVRPWIVASAVISAWIFLPEVRRIVDSRVGYNSVSIVSALPLLALVPLVIPLLYTRRLEKLDRGTALLGWTWFGGFTFSLAVSLVQQNVFGGVYAYALFCLPAIFGFWLATSEVTGTQTYDRIATFMLWCGTVVAIYGVLQFVALPQWDADWMNAAKIVSIGIAKPFMFRPFSTLNSPALFADFLVVVILLNLPRLQASKFIGLLQVGLLTGVLILTMVRSDWLGGAVGALVYVLLSPQRLRNLTVISAVAIVGFVLVSNASALLGNSDAGTSISSRFSTFDNLDGDVSYNEREKYFGAVLADALAQPFGQGLGVVGTAAKLGNTGETKDFDNGFIARFTEMGYFGMACYLATVIGALVIALRRWRSLRGPSMIAARGRAAAIVAVQAALFSMDLSSDHHSALPGLFFWLAVALLPAYVNVVPERASRPSGLRSA